MKSEKRREEKRREEKRREEKRREEKRKEEDHTVRSNSVILKTLSRRSKYAVPILEYPFSFVVYSRNLLKQN
jgi:hypothetical protein